MCWLYCLCGTSFLVYEGCLCLLVFFFCQAEDGIRDFHGTGVQTCALPISEADRPAEGDGVELTHTLVPTPSVGTHCFATLLRRGHDGSLKRHARTALG